MVKKWTHGHSIGFGALTGAVIASRRPELLILAGVTVGFLLAKATEVWGWVATHWMWQRSRTIAARPRPPKPGDSQGTDVPF